MNVKYIASIVAAVAITALTTFLLTSSTTSKSNDVVRNVADVVYDADYSRKINLNSYNAIENYSIDDIVLPYINIDSEDADKANLEIKTMFDGLVEIYKTNLEDKTMWISAKYFTYESGLKNSEDRFASVIIIKTIGGITLPVSEYKSYSFNLTTKKNLSMGDVINVFKATLDSEVDMKTKIKDMIISYENKVLENNTNLSVEEKTNLVNTAISSFEQLYDTNKLPIFLDNAGQLNIVVKIYSENKTDNITLQYK